MDGYVYIKSRKFSFVRCIDNNGGNKTAPDLWAETFAIYMEKSGEIEGFQKLLTKHSRIRVILQELERLPMSVIQLPLI